jgi:hypothetical protein
MTDMLYIAAPEEAVETIDPALAPEPARQVVIDALAYDAGVLLGTTINQWVEHR